LYAEQPDLFREIAQRYRELVLASDDRDSLASRLMQFDPRVNSSYQL